MSHIRIEQAQVKSGIQILLINLDGLLKGLFCGLILANLLLGQAQSEVVIGTGRIQGQAFLESPNRFF